MVRQSGSSQHHTEHWQISTLTTFFWGHQSEAQDSQVQGGRGDVSLGKESARQIHTNGRAPCRQTLSKATAQLRGYTIKSHDISQTEGGL